MENIPESPNNGEQAVELRKLGYKIVVVRRRGKAPVFKGFQTLEYTDEELLRIFACDYNLGVLTGGDLVALDIDTADTDKVEWVRENCGDTPMKVLTPSGGQHWYFRTRVGVLYGNGVKLLDQPYDLRWNGCFVVCPPSRNAEGLAYTWAGQILPASELPILKVSALRERKRYRKSEAPQVRAADRLGTGIKDIRAYVRKIPSVQGSDGSGACFRVACLLLEHGLSFDAAMAELLAWSKDCAVPPWRESELAHKLRDAYRKVLGRDAP